MIIHIHSIHNGIPHHIWKLNQDQINNLKITITPKEIETVIKSLPTKKKKPTPKPDNFSVELYQIFQKELIPILLKLFNQIENRKNIVKFFRRGPCLFDTQTRDSIKKENYRPVSSWAMMQNYSIKCCQSESKSTWKTSSTIIK